MPDAIDNLLADLIAADWRFWGPYGITCIVIATAMAVRYILRGGGER